MAGVIQVDNMTRGERARLMQAIGGSGGSKELEGDTEEGEWYTPWYVRPLQVFVYVFAYSMLGLGWLTTHIGQAMTWIGGEAKKAARSID